MYNVVVSELVVFLKVKCYTLSHFAQFSDYKVDNQQDNVQVIKMVIITRTVQYIISRSSKKAAYEEFSRTDDHIHIILYFQTVKTS